MKTGVIIGGIVIILAVVFGGWWLMNSPAEPSDEEIREALEETTPEDPGSGQFLQMVPPGVTENDIEPALGEVPGEEAAGNEVTISMDEAGFTPASITIPTGTTVNFVNNGQAPHWPASDVHPTHEVLPEFDSKQGLQTGETYSYTFTQAGTWSCHDHLMPSATCTITVTSNQ